jgi:hypothetical protein
MQYENYFKIQDSDYFGDEGRQAWSGKGIQKTFLVNKMSSL